MQLNSHQQAAVEHRGTPLLILAGAGSGKTRVLTCRIEHLLETGDAQPHEILAVTFTNKAAQELKSRLGGGGGGMWVGTFHSICARILRQDIQRIGYGDNFVIYDDSEQAAVIRAAIERLNLDDKAYTPKSVLSQISKAKSRGLTPEKFIQQAMGYQQENVGRLFDIYQKQLKSQNALDFDDLLLLTVQLLDKEPEVRERYRARFKHVLVDEYQDTNRTQYELVSHFANENLTVVGDVDQSIYSFRAADFSIIMDFQKDYPDARLIKLEENYRSTKKILNAANAVIENNTQRYPKELRTSNPEGELITLYSAPDERAEANWVVSQILRLRGNRKPSDFAVLYRTNAQSRALEEGFHRSGLPYRLFGGMKFYERKEIKDVLAYVRLTFNPKDDAAFSRVANVPRRGVGQTSLEKIQEAAYSRGVSMLEAVEQGVDLGTKQSRAMTAFAGIIRGLSLSTSPTELLERILSESGYQAELEADRTPEGQARVENVRELLSVAQDFERESEDTSMAAFLTQMALVSDLDSMKEEEDAVTLMTLHSSKGLEFPVVFLCGMEEGLFPHKRTLDAPDELEEERRICYVGITRAREKLSLTYAEKRMIFGSETYSLPSRFISEIPSDLMQKECPPNPASTGRSSSNAYGSRGAYGSSGASSGARPTPASRQRKEEVPWTQDFAVAVKVNFEVGDKVVHPSFGRGVVAKIIGSGERTCVAVAFPGLGQKILDLRFAPLTPAD